MIIKDNVSNLELSGISKDDINIAQIVPNAIMMDIIGNKLYKNKIDSTVREILSNAVDACVKAETKEPVIVHLPSMLEPWFSIKDYGIGMNKETLTNVYFNYGASTKRNTNKLIGGFGIGAKVAGVYSGQYTVTSIKDGHKCIFQAFKNEQGMPCNVCLLDEDTNEPNGTEVKIAANNTNDFYTFKDCLIKYATWINYPIKAGNIQFIRPEFEHEQKEFGIKKQSTYGNYIIVGGICYAFDWYSIEKFGLKHPIVDSYITYFADIGEIDLIASREEVEYTDKTKNFFKNLNNKVNEWYKEYLKDKTAFWLHQNKKAWETADRGYFNYGFSILSKSYKRWSTGSREKIFKKYIFIDNLFGKDANGLDEIKKINWLQACEKVDGDSTTVAFLDKNNVDDLVKLGCDKANIIDFASLPKRKIGKKKAHRILYIKKNGGIGHTRVDEIVGDTFNIIDEDLMAGYYKYDRHKILKKILGDGVTITADNSKPSELVSWIKTKYGEHTSVTYCSVIDILEKMKFLKKKTKNDNPKNYEIMKHFNLIKGEEVNLSAKFPLLAYLSNYDTHNDKKDHIKYYVDWVLKRDKDALSHKYLEVL